MAGKITGKWICHWIGYQRLLNLRILLITSLAQIYEESLKSAENGAQPVTETVAEHQPGVGHGFSVGIRDWGRE
jgi:hypothetical protein